MRRKSLIALGLTTSLTAPAAAESWYNVLSDTGQIAYADADSVTRQGNFSSLNIMVSHQYGDFHTFTLQFECGGEQYRIVSAANLGSDRKYLDTPAFEASWVAFDPSLAPHRTFACDGGVRSNPISDPFADSEDYWYYYYDY